MGWNLGADEDRFARLCERVDAMARKEREPLTLVGWSLGGLYAREVAKVMPQNVAMVVTMGTPSGDRRANNAWRAYQAVTGHEVDNPPVGEDLAEKPPCPPWRCGARATGSWRRVRPAAGPANATGRSPCAAPIWGSPAIRM
jgi:pimeloyl-ACP methyl ester carboxylesterase